MLRRVLGLHVLGLIVVVLSPATSGCSLVQVQRGGAGGGAASADCASASGAPLDPAAPREQHITSLLCADGRYTPGNPSERDYVRWHFAFDDRRFDPVLASMIVVSCAAGDRCQYPYVAGQIAYYAQATPEAVAAGVAALQLDAGVKQAWVERYRGARDLILAAVAAIGPDDAPLVRDLPAAVRAERANYHARTAADHDAYAALAPELDAALAAKRGDRALIERAVALRDRHVRTCVAETPFSTSFCWHGTIARPLTHAIAWLAVYAGDALVANLEEDTLGTGLDVTGAANHISMMQEAARDIGQRYSWEPWTRLDGLREERRTELAQQVKRMQDGLDWAGEALKGVGRRGATATISYQTRVSSSTGYACGDKIHLRDDGSGGIRAYRKCRVSSHDTDTHVTRSVTVPASDTPGLAKGNFVLTVFDPKTRRGRVIYARPNAYSEQRDLSRIRFTNLKPKVDKRDRAAIERVGSY